LRENQASAEAPLEVVEGQESSTLGQMIFEYLKDEIEAVVSFHTNQENGGDWNLQEISETVATVFPLTSEDKEKILNFKNDEKSKLGDVQTRDAIVKFLIERAKKETRGFPP
jgi:hypothetical protein